MPLPGAWTVGADTAWSPHDSGPGGQINPPECASGSSRRFASLIPPSSPNLPSHPTTCRERCGNPHR